MAESIHIGRKIGRIRELRGIKQEYLASELGISQQSISKIEQSETVEEDKLQQIAQVLGVTAEAIKNFSEEAVINIISSTLHDNAGSVNNNCTLNFNPMDKLLEVIEENKKLYERLLQAEKEKNGACEEFCVSTTSAVFKVHTFRQI
jgi:transcriptional regulator with XRE-family HTH domain